MQTLTRENQYIMKNIIAAGLVICSLYSCSSTNLVHISVLEPAEVTLPKDVKTAAILNRSLPGKDNKGLDAMDKLFTLEGVNLDKEGGKASIEGLTDELVRNNRFTEIKPVLNSDLGTTGTGLFSGPLAWDVVAKICKDNNADILFALELFDTDSKVSYAANQVSLKTPIGSIPAIEHQATMQTIVKTRWRIYDPVTKLILDEYPISTSLSFYGKGINPTIAAAAIIDRKDAVKQVGTKVGQIYALRIIPTWFRVTRDYYVKGSENFVVGRRKANTGNWDEAGALWLKDVDHPSEKVAGRACYNMAIISEINGDIEKAIQWAQKSYENYNNKLALRYVNILKDRRISNDILKEQQAE